MADSLSLSFLCVPVGCVRVSVCERPGYYESCLTSNTHHSESSKPPPDLCQLQLFSVEHNSKPFIMDVHLRNADHSLPPSLFYDLQDCEVGSAETESDPDEEFMAELIRQMAHFMFQDDDKLEKSWGSAGSPQSTDWSPLRMNHERQIDISRDPSPPGPIMMEEFEKMKMNSEVPLSMSNSNVEFHSKQSLIDDQIRAIRVKHRSCQN
ncbi:hypothetical protein Pint_32680 [Pistacia integerrima]|uniref:Uncharacterized protein n=1 Tax=Pistacia integerrima TaxID=434235 RepID=A0ACC0XQC9_9ROSI|nr:hypothetical protein Pint_32680 [Pistacia integerrima]